MPARCPMVPSMEKPMRRHLKDRFWAKVDKRGKKDCWEWAASRDSLGYGRIRSGSRILSAHRLSWELHKGPIPVGLSVLHRCDNPPCCNPVHLFLGSQQDNVSDMIMKGRRKVFRGIENGNARLTENIVRAIRATMEPQRKIAKQFNICQSTVGKIKNRKIWRHLP
jgi:hypothetical protein